MKAFIITIFLIVFSATTFAADSTVVKLMQKVIEMKIPSSYKYYYLLDKAENPKGDTYFIEDIKNNPKMDLLKPLNEIQKEIQTDTSSFNWSSYHFQRAKFTDRIHLPKHISLVRIIRIMPIGTKQSIIDSLESDTDFDVIVVLVRRNASKKEIEKQKKKTIEAIHNRPEKESNYFTFSKPVFSNDKKYALLSYAKLGSGGQCIFKNNNGIWELVLENNWVA